MRLTATFVAPFLVLFVGLAQLEAQTPQPGVVADPFGAPASAPSLRDPNGVLLEATPGSRDV